jgi:hypothetical protein
MHYYKRNLGDYAKKCGRLTMLQHGSYTLLIDACYDRETFPTLEQALEWTWASTDAEVEAVKFVLSRFFKLDKDGCYVQDRILEELLQYHKNADTNKRIAEEREAKRREKRTNREQTVDEAPPNHKPLTTNQEPRTIVKTNRGMRLPPELEIPNEYVAFCQQERQDLDPHKVWAQFKDYWTAQPGQKGVKTDWAATWRNWVRRQEAPKNNVSKTGQMNQTVMSGLTRGLIGGGSNVKLLGI